MYLDISEIRVSQANYRHMKWLLKFLLKFRVTHSACNRFILYRKLFMEFFQLRCLSLSYLIMNLNFFFKKRSEHFNLNLFRYF